MKIKANRRKQEKKGVYKLKNLNKNIISCRVKGSDIY